MQRPLCANLAVVIEVGDEDGGFDLKYVITSPTGDFAAGSVAGETLMEALNSATERFSEVIGAHLRREARLNALKKNV